MDKILGQLRGDIGRYGCQYDFHPHIVIVSHHHLRMIDLDLEVGLGIVSVFKNKKPGRQVLLLSGCTRPGETGNHGYPSTLPMCAISLGRWHLISICPIRIRCAIVSSIALLCTTGILEIFPHAQNCERGMHHRGEQPCPTGSVLPHSRRTDWPLRQPTIHQISHGLYLLSLPF